MILGGACLVMGFIVGQKGYRLFSVLEFLIVAYFYFFDFNFGFSSFHTVKLFMSFFFFVLEVVLWNPSKRRLQKRSYLTSSSSAPCKALINNGGSVLNHNLPREATSEERSKELPLPSIHKKIPSEFRSNMFFMPCMGFAIGSPKNAVRDRLK